MHHTLKIFDMLDFIPKTVVYSPQYLFLLKIKYDLFQDFT